MTLAIYLQLFLCTDEITFLVDHFKADINDAILFYILDFEIPLAIEECSWYDKLKGRNQLFWKVFGIS